jgi:hypothetical protein
VRAAGERSVHARSTSACGGSNVRGDGDGQRDRVRRAAVDRTPAERANDHDDKYHNNGRADHDDRASDDIDVDRASDHDDDHDDIDVDVRNDDGASAVGTGDVDRDVGVP